MKWVAQLSGDKSDLKELSKSLKDDELRVVEQTGQYFLESEKFNGLATYKEVTSVATEILSLLTGSIKLVLGGRTPIKIASIIRICKNGRRDLFGTSFVTVNTSIRTTSEIRGSNGTIKMSNQADEVLKLVKLGISDKKVAKALRLFGTNKHDWVSLYRLYEVIEEDIGVIEKISRKKWATKKSINRFKQTANSPTAIGDASRHGKENTLAPSNPMKLSKAECLIEFILHNWLRSKLED